MHVCTRPFESCVRNNNNNNNDNNNDNNNNDDDDNNNNNVTHVVRGMSRFLIRNRY